MAEEKKSRLYTLKPLIERWPAVAKPEGHVNCRSKILWTILCLVIYFVLTNIMIWGVGGTVLDMFAGFRAIMAGASGSIMHLGIGPIVTASIILQLFVGAKIIKLDLTKKEDKAIYQGTQKILVIVMILVEAVPQVYGYLSPSDNLITMVGGTDLANAIIISQLFINCYIRSSFLSVITSHCSPQSQMRAVSVLVTTVAGTTLTLLHFLHCAI